jgi:hypothetical protein
MYHDKRLTEHQVQVVYVVSDHETDQVAKFLKNIDLWNGNPSLSDQASGPKS